MRHAWLLLLVASAGCVDLKSSYPDRKYYALSAERVPGGAAAAPKDSVLRVRRFTASKGSDGTEMVSRLTDSGYESDFYSVFWAPPSNQLTEQTQRWLSASGLFSAVVGTGSSLPETHVLEGNLVSLHADQRSAKAAVLEVQFMLIRVGSDPSASIFQKSYRETTPVSESGTEAMVRGWETGLRRILLALESDLAKVDRSPGK